MRCEGWCKFGDEGNGLWAFHAPFGIGFLYNAIHICGVMARAGSLHMDLGAYAATKSWDFLVVYKYEYTHYFIKFDSTVR